MREGIELSYTLGIQYSMRTEKGENERMMIIKSRRRRWNNSICVKSLHRRWITEISRSN